jgi:hypothetical protein
MLENMWVKLWAERSKLYPDFVYNESRLDNEL